MLVVRTERVKDHFRSVNSCVDSVMFASISLFVFSEEKILPDPP